MRATKFGGGFTLFELLVAMAISTIIVLSLVTLMGLSKTTYVSNQASIRLNENARLALSLLSFDLRMAGYLGCKATDSETVIPVVGTEGKPSQRTSDSLTTQFADPRLGTFELLPNISSATDTIDVVASRESTIATAADLIHPGDTISIADCKNAELHDVLSVSGNRITFDGSTYAAKSDRITTVTKFMTYKYMVDLDPQTGTPTLYRQTNKDAREPIVEGIDYMRVLFGVDTSGDGRVDRTVSASSLTDTTQVKQVTVGLLARSISDGQTTSAPAAGQHGAQPDSRSYQILDINNFTATNERVYRDVFSQLVSLRNGR